MIDLRKGCLRGNVKLTITKSQLRLVIFWSLVILVAPFALETVMLAELAGAEFAIGFLLLYLKQSMLALRDKVARLKRYLGSIAEISANHLAFSERQFLSHAGFSLAAIALGSPIFFTAVIWYPVLVTGTYT